MSTWTLTLESSEGPLESVETGEAQFVLGTESGPDVYTVRGVGVAPRHACVWIGEAQMQVEDLAGGTRVNGHPVTGRVKTAYPASVQVGELTLVVETGGSRLLKSNSGAQNASLPQSLRTRPAPDTPQPIWAERRTPTSPGIHGPVPGEVNTAALRGEYKLVREIACGGMGQIHLGEDPQLGRLVAVKVSSVACEGENPRFQREARVLAQLAHPNIVPIHAQGIDARGRPFYSMKLIQGRTLQAVLDLIRDGDAAAIKDYPPAALLTIFRKACDAIMFAHSKGILHRDLKPENIMVGEYGEVLVMDWGLAKILGENEKTADAGGVRDTGDYGMTLEGEVMGTPQYMSPEQAGGMVAGLDHRSDIYSLGGILYAILLLRPPIEGTTLNEVLTRVRKGSISEMLTHHEDRKGSVPRGPSPMHTGVPDALRAVTLKAMATDRNNRYGSVQEFAADIEAYQNGFATSAEDAGALRQLVLFINRNRAVSATAGLLLLAVIGFTLRLAASEKIARASERRAREEMENSRRSEAEAQIVLADSAYALGNAEQMRTALQKVPPDLRNQVWRYLDENTAGGDLTVPAEAESSWMGLEPHPSQAGSFLALSSRGAFCAIEGATGKVTELWKTPETIGFAGQFSVSKDGSTTAFFAHARALRGADEIQIRRVEDGNLVRAIPLPPDRVLMTRLWVSQNHLVAQVGYKAKKGSSISTWSLADGALLWEIPQRSWNSCASFASNPAELLLVTSDGELQRIDVATGKVLALGKSQVGRGSGMENYAGGRDWRKLAINTSSPQRVRVFSDAWNDKLQTDFVARYKVLSLAFVPDTDLLLMLCGVSDQAGCLEVRDCSQGARLVRSFPFTNPRLRWDHLNGLRCSGGFAALLLPNRIRIWNFSETVPLQNSTHVGGNAVSGTKLSPDGLHLLGFRKASEMIAARLEEIHLYEVSPGGDSPKETGKLVLPPEEPGAPPVLRGGLADKTLMIEFDRTGSRALFKSNTTALALKIEAGELKNVWGMTKRILSKSSSGQGMLIHPDADLFWTGDALWEFSSGRELRRINRGQFRHYLTGHPVRVSWLGPRHVVEECPVPHKNDEASEEYASNRIVLWNIETGEPTAHEVSPHGLCLATSPDGNGLAEGCSDSRVRFRNPKTLAVEREFRVHDSPVKSIDWHPSLPILATLGLGEVRFWDIHSGRMLEEIRIKQEAPTLRFVANGSRLLVGGMLFEPRSCSR